MSYIFIVIPSLGAGGAEREALILSGKLQSAGFGIEIVILCRTDKPLYQLPPSILITSFAASRVIYAMPAFLLHCRKTKPDIIISFGDRLTVYFGLFSSFLPRGTKLIAKEITVKQPAMSLLRYSVFKCGYQIVWKFLYNRFAAVVCQSPQLRNGLISACGITRGKSLKEKICVISNPVDIDYIRERSNESNTVPISSAIPYILAIGRLDEVKRYNLLLEAFALCAEKNIQLIFAGSGSQQHMLEKLTFKLQIKDIVHFVGFTPNPFPLVKHALCTVFTSRFEGMPNGALESLCLGTPVIAFNCPGSFCEIIEDGENGFLVPDGNIPMLSEAILKALDYSFDCERIKKTAEMKYNADVITGKYILLFRKVYDDR